MEYMMPVTFEALHAEIHLAVLTVVARLFRLLAEHALTSIAAPLAVGPGVDEGGARYLESVTVERVQVSSVALGADIEVAQATVVAVSGVRHLLLLLLLLSSVAASCFLRVAVEAASAHVAVPAGAV